MAVQTWTGSPVSMLDFVEHWQERAAIIEHDGRLDHAQAEKQAAVDMSKHYLLLRLDTAQRVAAGAGMTGGHKSVDYRNSIH